VEKLRPRSTNQQKLISQNSIGLKRVSYTKNNASQYKKSNRDNAEELDTTPDQVTDHTLFSLNQAYQNEN
jgi:hypothetical protein